MKIKDERIKESSMYFEDLNPGDVYELDDEVFMKICELMGEDCECNAVSLEDGCLYVHEPEEKVTPLIVQLNIVRNG